MHAQNEPHRSNNWQLKNLENYPYKLHIVRSIKISKNDYDPYIYLSYDYFYYLIKTQPDVIVCTGFSPATIQSLIYCRMFNKKYIIWNEGTAHTDQLSNGLKYRIRKMAATNANCFVVAGILSERYIKEQLNCDKKFFLSHNCNDTSFISKNVQNSKPQNSHIKILSIGNLIQQKGIWEIVETFKLAKNKIKTAELNLVGDGSEKQALQHQISVDSIPDINIVGSIPFVETLKYWQEAEVFLILSHSDRNPLVLTEALAAGLPIVCSKYVGSHPDFVHPGKNGYVVDPFNPDEVVDAIEKCLEGNRDGSMSRYSLKLSEHLTYDNAAKGFIDAIKYAYYG